MLHRTRPGNARPFFNSNRRSNSSSSGHETHPTFHLQYLQYSRLKLPSLLSTRLRNFSRPSCSSSNAFQNWSPSRPASGRATSESTTPSCPSVLMLVAVLYLGNGMLFMPEWYRWRHLHRSEHYEAWGSKLYKWRAATLSVLRYFNS